jgi:hypothetical protein
MSRIFDVQVRRASADGEMLLTFIDNQERSWQKQRITPGFDQGMGVIRVGRPYGTTDPQFVESWVVSPTTSGGQSHIQT